MALREQLLSKLPFTLRTTLKPVGKLVVDTFVRISQLDEISTWLARHEHLLGLNFVEVALDFLNARALFDPDELQHIPLTGAAIVVANHPLGAIDALLLLKLVGDQRRDVKILANDWLLLLKPLSELLIPVSVFSSDRGTPVRQVALDALARGELIVVFPAAEVSRFSARGLVDPRWHSGCVHLARKTGAPIIPVHLDARNSWPFYLSSLASKSLSAALLPREMMRARGVRVPLRIGAPIAHDSESKREPRGVLERVRQALFDLPKRSAHAQLPFAPARPVARSIVNAEIAQLDLIGETPDGKAIYVGRLGLGSQLMRELARLRELSFRAVGEGGGTRYDWDRFDGDYDHLLVWDRDEQEIAGAYRLRRTPGVALADMTNTLYSATLFRFDAAFEGYLAAGCELGRSFVQPKYWGTRSLDYLWLGIGAYLNRYPEIRYLFGPVSASASLGEPARDLLTHYYARHFPDHDALAQPLKPYAIAKLGETECLDAEAEYLLLKANLKALGASVPTLYRQYTDLCEAGGVRFLGFALDPAFANCVDGMILIDLKKLKAKKRARYFATSKLLTRQVAI